MTDQLLHGDQDIPCPECGFEVWIRLSEVVAECAVLCPLCRTRLWLRDSRGQMSNLGAEVESQLDQVLKELF
ncbi:hypothetical protein ACWGE0_31680 [Lentzea sp. NPDC054927]